MGARRQKDWEDWEATSKNERTQKRGRSLIPYIKTQTPDRPPLAAATGKQSGKEGKEALGFDEEDLMRGL